jgi:hypothetical protein
MKKIKNYSIHSLIVLILSVEIFFYFSFSSKFHVTCEQIQNALSDLRVYFSNPKTTPSDRQLQQIMKSRGELQKLLSQILYTFESMISSEPRLKALEFKQKLRTEAQNNAGYKIPIPQDLGFLEFLGEALPAEDQLAQFSRQLLFHIDLIKLLISNNVEAITEMNRLPSGNGIKSTLSEKKLFSVYTTQIFFKITHPNLIQFMNTLCTQPTIVKIEALDIESNFKQDAPSAESQVLAVTMILSLTEYEK